MKKSLLYRIPARLGHESRIYRAKTVQLVRGLFPYPKLWARLTGKRVPVSYIVGKRSELYRPESIGFSPSGDLMVITNSDHHSLSVYSKNTSGGNYDSEPYCVISNSSCLNFTHDAVFTPCGKYIVAVGREDHTLSLFALPEQGTHEKETTPLWIYRGDDNELSYPAGVAVHPSGRWLAVANRVRFGITLYQRSESNNHFDSTPFQKITEQELNGHGLAAPHGLDFSADGQSLVAVHKYFWLEGVRSKGDSGLSLFKCRREPNTGLDPDPTLIFPIEKARLHSVAFDPSAERVAITYETGGIEVYNLSPDQKRIIKQESVHTFRVNGIPKGIAFTRNGEQLVTTTMFNEVLFLTC